MICYAQKCLISCFITKYAQKFEDRERKKHIFNLIRFFFNFHFFDQVTLSRSSFIQTNIFCKKLFFSIIFNTAYFNNNFLFQMESFFLFNIPKYIFFEENEQDVHFQFFNFLLQIKYHLIFLQRNKVENFFFFCIFFWEFNCSNK